MMFSGVVIVSLSLGRDRRWGEASFFGSLAAEERCFALTAWLRDLTSMAWLLLRWPRSPAPGLPFCFAIAFFGWRGRWVGTVEAPVGRLAIRRVVGCRRGFDLLVVAWADQDAAVDQL